MLIMNILLSREFIRSKRRIANINQNRTMKREYHFTATVIGMNITFFILYTPWSIYFILNYVSKGLVSWQTPLITAIIALYQSITFSIAYLNNMSSLFLNLTFNVLFRREFLVIISKTKLISSIAEPTINNSKNQQPRFSINLLRKKSSFAVGRSQNQ